MKLKLDHLLSRLEAMKRRNIIAEFVAFKLNFLKSNSKNNFLNTICMFEIVIIKWYSKHSPIIWVMKFKLNHLLSHLEALKRRNIIAEFVAFKLNYLKSYLKHYFFNTICMFEIIIIKWYSKHSLMTWVMKLKLNHLLSRLEALKRRNIIVEF